MKQLSMYINGRFETDFNGTWRDVLNPATEEVIAREPKGGKADVDRAVAAARDAQTAWERLPAVERGAYLRKIAQGIRERADELTDTIVAEGGKTKDLARIEVMFTADYLDYQPNGRAVMKAKSSKATARAKIFYCSNVLWA